MEEKRTTIQNEFEALAKKLEDPHIYATPEGAKVAKRHAQLSEHLSLFDDVARLEEAVHSTASLVDESDDEMKTLAQEELDTLTRQLDTAKERLNEALIPQDPLNEKRAVVEIRAGAGGDEASLFAGELYRMYVKHCETKNWKVELMSESPSDVGGFKEISFEVKAEGSYGWLKFESGVHRVQRIPSTESGGRIHTSTASVAVLPEAEEQDIEIADADIRIDVFRSSGPGGQSVNTTDSAVRITHLPTSIIVTCQDEKSQHKNRDKAMNILRSRLLAAKIEEEAKARADQRKNQIGSGDRSEKIRTYNFPQDRLTDHRIGLSIHGLPQIMEGDIDTIIESLQQADLEIRKQQ